LAPEQHHHASQLDPGQLDAGQLESGQHDAGQLHAGRSQAGEPHACASGNRPSIADAAVAGQLVQRLVVEDPGSHLGSDQRSRSAHQRVGTGLRDEGDAAALDAALEAPLAPLSMRHGDTRPLDARHDDTRQPDARRLDADQADTDSNRLLRLMRAVPAAPQESSSIGGAAEQDSTPLGARDDQGHDEHGTDGRGHGAQAPGEPEPPRPADDRATIDDVAAEAGDVEGEARAGLPVAPSERAAPLPAPPPIHVDEHLDAAGSSRSRLAKPELELLEAVKRRIAGGKLILPKLPSTHATLLHLTSGDDISTRLIVEAIERDPMMAGELLHAANAVTQGAAEPARTVTAAVVRLGARNLRTLLWSMTLKATAPEDEGLARHALESWRQSAAMARMARLYAAEVGRAPEEVHMAVLLADVGKVALIATLRRELESRKQAAAPSAALLGCLFREEHEAAGAQLARLWRLPEDIVDNCLGHHDWRTARDGKLAALTSLVQRLDMLLALGAEVAFQNAVRRDEFDALGIPWPARAARLSASAAAWRAG
jgi:HD-like signal output (HDOD) protein